MDTSVKDKANIVKSVIKTDRFFANFMYIFLEKRLTFLRE